MSNPNIKTVFFGDPNVGKTTFVKRFITGRWDTQYIPTLGVDVYPCCLSTSKGRFCIDLWDLAGQEKYGLSRDQYYQGAKVGIGMFDLHSPNSLRSVDEWITSFKAAVPDALVILVGNKCDLGFSIHQGKAIRTVIEKHNVKMYPISAKNLYNQEKPFLDILRWNTGDPTLILV